MTDEIRKLAEQALEDDGRCTPGPWFLDHGEVRSEELLAEYDRVESTIPEDATGEAYDALPCTIVACVPVADDDMPTIHGEKDGHFIAAARSREPRLAEFALAVLDELHRRRGVHEFNRLEAAIARNLESRRRR